MLGMGWAIDEEFFDRGQWDFTVLGSPLREVVDILEVAMLNFKILEINDELANNGSVL